MAGNFLISNKNVPSAFKKLELQRQWSAISTRGRGPGGAALDNSCQRHEFVARGWGGGWSGGIHPRKFWKSRGLEMVFSMFSKKTQPGYGVKQQVLLVLTACTCTPPPQKKKKKKKVQGGLGAKS